MPRRLNPAEPASDAPRIPGGAILLWIGAGLFGASMAAGLVQSFTTGHWLPSVGVEYTTELNALIQERGSAAALPQVRSAARIDFDNVAAVNRLLESAREAGNSQDVVWALLALARLKPEDGRVRIDLASVLLDQGRVGDAFAQARFAVWLAPNSSESHCTLGAVLLQLDRQQAAAAYRRALEIDPASQAARRGLQLALQGS